MRSVSELAAVAVLVALSVAAAALLYEWAAGLPGLGDGAASGARVGLGCLLKVDAASQRGGAIVAYVRLLGCGGEGVDAGYLDAANGSSYPLEAGWPRNLSAPPGRPVMVLLYGRGEDVPPGVYRLRLVTRGGVEASAGEVRVGGNFSTAGAAVWSGIDGLTRTLKIPGGTVTLEVEPVGGVYRLWFSVTPDPGYSCVHETAVILNASLQPPVYIGPWYFYDGDCVAQYWQPLIPQEQPYLVVVTARLVPG